jgi:hypothetical protein
MEQPDLFGGPAKPAEATPAYGTDPEKLARVGDPSTSHAAAAKVDSSRLERMVHKQIATYGDQGAVASDLLRDFSNFPYSSITARFSALERKRLITCGPDKRLGSSNRSQRVMRSIKAPE